MYLESTPTNINKIEAALRQKDYPALKLIVHSMKPHLNFMGMERTRNLANKIEETISTNKLQDSLEKMVAQLCGECRKSIIELSE